MRLQFDEQKGRSSPPNPDTGGNYIEDSIALALDSGYENKQKKFRKIEIMK